MKKYTLSANGDYYIGNDTSNIRSRHSSAIKIFNIPSGATVALGCDDSTGSFSQYTDGVITGDVEISHGVGTKLMIRIAGLTSGSVILGVSE